jgi:hypothetical protein
MPDLLTHVLVVYAVATALSWRVDALERRHVPVAMIGGALPDLSKLYLVVDADTVAGIIGVPISWEGMHTLGVVLVLSVVGTQLVERRERVAVLLALALGELVHFGLDSFIIRADGTVPPYLFPISWWQFPSGNLYVSSDIWPSLCALTLFGIVFGYGWIARYRNERTGH